MKCPVCKTECGEADKCLTCGFDQLKMEFLNIDDANAWMETNVLQYRHKYEYELLRLINSHGDYKLHGTIKPGAKVIHKKYGIGKITEVCDIAEKQGVEYGIDDRNMLVDEHEADNRLHAKITVRFADGTERKFAYPMAFDKGFLSFV